MKVVACHRLGGDFGLDGGSLGSWAEEVVCSGPCLICPMVVAILLRANRRQCRVVGHGWDVALVGEVEDCSEDTVGVVEEGDGPSGFGWEEGVDQEYTVDVDCP